MQAALESYVLTYRQRPWTLNEERGRGGKGHWAWVSPKKAEWRDAFGKLARQAKVPPLRRVDIEVRQFCPTKVMPDPGNIEPSVKAAIDGLVDARIIPDDNGVFVRYVRYWAPELSDRDAVELTIIGQPLTPDEQQERRVESDEKAARSLRAKRAKLAKPKLISTSRR